METPSTTEKQKEHSEIIVSFQGKIWWSGIMKKFRNHLTKTVSKLLLDVPYISCITNNGNQNT